MGGMINQDIINAQQAEINRLCAELADARLERDNIAALNSSLIAELVEAKKAMTSLRPSVAELRDEVLATLKMANDRIAEVVSQRDGLQFVYERSLKENERAEARVAELEANAVETVLEWSKLCAARERAMRARAERAEVHVEQLQAKLHCVCGSPVDHSSMEGHSPVSMYDYALERAEAERDAMREFLEGFREAEARVLDIIDAALAPPVLIDDLGQVWPEDAPAPRHPHSIPCRAEVTPW